MIALVLLATVLGDRIAVRPAEPLSRARYIAGRSPDEPGLAVQPYRAHGFTQRARLLPDGTTEITVVARRRELAQPGDPTTRSPEAVATLRRPEPAPAIRELTMEVVNGASDDWEASERILTWVSLNIAHLDAPSHEETGLSTLEASAASCVGRAVLAAEMLRAARIPARTVHGLLLTTTPAGPCSRCCR